MATTHKTRQDKTRNGKTRHTNRQIDNKGSKDRNQNQNGERERETKRESVKDRPNLIAWNMR